MLRRESAILSMAKNGVMQLLHNEWTAGRLGESNLINQLGVERLFAYKLYTQLSEHVCGSFQFSDFQDTYQYP
jgi:hypothetical protein